MALMATTRRFSFRAVDSPMRGHEYFLEVSYHSCDRAVLESDVQSRVLSRLHGHDLTKIVSPATGAVLVEWIHEQLAASELAPRIVGVALQETRQSRFVSARSNVRMV